MSSLPRSILFAAACAAAGLWAPLNAAPASSVADAAMQGDKATVTALVKSGADINAAQGDGMTGLHWAALKNDVDLGRLLLKGRANVEVTTRLGGYTPLLLAAKDGNVAMIKELLAAGADPNAATSHGTTALMFAAAAGSGEGVTALLENHVDIDAKETKGETALMMAAANGRAEVVRTLAARGADFKAVTKSKDLTVPPKAPPPPEPGRIVVDPNAPQLGRAGGNYPQSLLVFAEGGLSALHLAARQGHLDTVSALLAAGADINQPTAGDRTTPLLIAIINGRFDLAKYLLERGANPTSAAENGVTPLYATLNCQWAPVAAYPQPRAYEQQHTTYLELMTALLDKGAEPNARIKTKVWYSGYNFDQSGVNESGATPFWRAAYASDLAAMQLLVSRGGDPSIWTMKMPSKKNEAHDPGQRAYLEGYTSPLPPVPNGAPDVSPLLAAAGVGYVDGGGNTHRLAPTGMMPAVKYLVEELHLDVNARDSQGNTLLHEAASRGDNEMILYLVSKGADPLAVNRAGLTVLDWANGPVQKVQPFPETIKLLEKLGAKNNHLCVSC
jgi:uncharacterized protein